MSTNTEIIHGVYTAFGKGDVAGVLGAFDAKIVWREAEGYFMAAGNPYRGPNAVAEGVFGRIATEFESFSVQPQSTIDGGDAVVVQGRYRGKLRGSGRALDAQFAHVWNLRAGKVVEFQQYTDTLQWTRAKGD